MRQLPGIIFLSREHVLLPGVSIESNPVFPNVWLSPLTSEFAKI